MEPTFYQVPQIDFAGMARGGQVAPIGAYRQAVGPSRRRLIQQSGYVRRFLTKGKGVDFLEAIGMHLHEQPGAKDQKSAIGSESEHDAVCGGSALLEFLAGLVGKSPRTR